jgi:Domain of unknown function (DUF5615)
MPHRQKRKARGVRGFLIDENLDRALVDAIRRAKVPAGQPGYDPDALGVPRKGTPDAILATWAAGENYCVVTRDRGFLRAGHVPARHAGICVLLGAPASAADLARVLIRIARRRTQLEGLRFALAPGEMGFIEDDGSVALLDGRPFIVSID